MKRLLYLLMLVIFIAGLAAQYDDGPDSTAPAGILKNLTDDQLLEAVQQEIFPFFWHGAHPHKGLALTNDQPPTINYQPSTFNHHVCQTVHR